MKNVKIKYSITTEGNDLDAKTIQKLKKDEELYLERVNDGEDTFEITVSYEDKLLGLLEYSDSIGIAPFMDDGRIEKVTAKVDNVKIKEGKSRAKDKTILYFTVEYVYDESLTIFKSENDIFAFVPNDNIILAMAIYYCLTDGEDVIVNQSYLNMFDADIPMEYEEQFKMFECTFNNTDDYNFYFSVLFDEKFEKCKVRAKIYNLDKDDEEYEIELNEEEKETAITFVNHRRIFNGEDAFNCVRE